MDGKTTVPNWATRLFLFGIIFFIPGLLTNDLYIVVSALSLIIIGTIVATGEKVIQHIPPPPKGL